MKDLQLAQALAAHPAAVPHEGVAFKASIKNYWEAGKAMTLETGSEAQQRCMLVLVMLYAGNLRNMLRDGDYDELTRISCRALARYREMTTVPKDTLKAKLLMELQAVDGPINWYQVPVVEFTQQTATQPRRQRI